MSKADPLPSRLMRATVENFKRVEAGNNQKEADDGNSEA